MEPTIFLDESGNTGANLLDKTQPFFTMAGVDLSTEHAEMLISLVGTNSPKEVHFSSMKRRKSGQDGLLRLLSHPLICASNVKVGVYHKEFMIVSKIVDRLIEHMAYKTGFDLYLDGCNIAMSNVLHYCMPVFCTGPVVENMYKAFITMIKERDANSISAFYQSVEVMQEKSSNPTFASDLAMIAATRRFIHGALENLNKSDLDPLSPCLFFQGVAWGGKYPDGFHLVHDESKTLKANKALLEEFMQWTTSEIEIGYDRRKFKLPLKAKSLNFADSEAFPQIQVADVIASAVSFWAQGVAIGEADDPFFLALNKLNFRELLVNVVWPSLDVSPEALGTVHDGGTNPADASASFLMKARSEKGADDL